MTRMGHCLIFVLTFACGVTLVSSIATQFDELIRLTTFTHNLANFSNYGCHCGPGTQGVPVDPIDKCCHGHDCCYNKAQMFGCTPDTHRYRFYANGDKIKCVKSRDQCEKMVCECDQKAASCFRKHLFSYNPMFQNHPTMRCRGPRPFC
ncbi:phospholipase A2 homolog otoconin-22 [Alligator mississippiensis]|uniref:Phospholipase A2 n=1 Tax=Alligator mississippiensis TaxID=8496 RepID=A0A151N3Z9_ALLMI|nr:phospholipase A2 homolog otoconin-22 [Alligator mississippiensis]KYO31553.1 phospholipase A2-like protein otoconin-22-like [Alligator mississippiensis]